MNTPFKFLDSYTHEDREIFFGRDLEIEEVYQKIFSSKILLIYGISGTGKTSLINCGLANKFEDSDWLPVSIRRGPDIVKSIWTEINKLTLTPISNNSGGSKKNKPSLTAALQSIYLDHFKPIYLIFDQFEELFIFGDRRERKEFIGMVEEVIDADVQCKFLFSIREEYLAWVTEFESVIPEFLANRMRVEKMTRQHAIQAIEGPCSVHNIIVEAGLPEALLDKLNPEGNEIELTYLQVFLDKIYGLAQQAEPGLRSGITETSNTVTVAGTEETGMVTQELRFDKLLLDKAGDVSDLLGSFLEEQIRQLDEPDTGLTILKAFVSMQGTKKQVTEEEIRDFSRTLGKDIGEDKLKELIQRFVNLRILRDKDENKRYELRHDSLAAKIYEKITLVEKELLEVRQFIENARQTYEKRKILLSEKDLKYLQVYKDRLYLEGELQEFVELSKNAIQAKRRQFNTILRISLAGFIMVVAAIGYYYYRSTTETRKTERVAKSLLQSEIAPELAFRTAVDAYWRDTSSSISHFAILKVFNEMLDHGPYYDSLTDNYFDPYKRIFDFEPCDAEIANATFSRDGNLIYGWLEDHSIRVWDIYGKNLLSIEGYGSSVLALSLSGNNDYLAAVHSDSTGTLWNINGDKAFDFKVAINMVWNKSLVAFSTDNRYLAVAGPDNGIIIYELNGQEYQRLGDHSGRMNYISFSPDGRFISSASDDKTVIVWNLNRNTGYFGEYNTITGHSEPVRSCTFSANSKYILTASDDSTVSIRDLNGEEVFYIKPRTGWLYYKQNRICAAEFTGDEALIRITAYSTDSLMPSAQTEGSSMNDFAYNQTLLFEGGYHFLSRGLIKNKFVQDEYNDIVGGYQRWKEFIPVRYLDYNPMDGTTAYTMSGMDQIIITSADLLTLKVLTGSRPVFSPDGNYLLYMRGKQLILYPVSVREIIRLVSEEKIFGKLTHEADEWLHPF